MTHDPAPGDNLYTPSPQLQQPWPSTPPTKTRFSRYAIWGFIISCVGLLVFAFIGVMGVVLSARGLRETSGTGLRGRGLAIAGMIMGLLEFAFYTYTHVLNR
jgi:hypothetical protein